MINIMYTVDPIKRIVKPVSGHAVTEQDHEASSLRFAFPDNIPGTGLESTGVAVRVMYIRPDGGDPVAKTLTFYKHSGGYYLYDWDLQKSDLQKEGRLVFSLCILDISGGEVSEWHTTPCAVRVLSTIHTDDSDEGDDTITPTVKERVAVLESMIQRVTSGAPIVVSSTSAMTDTEQIYVLLTDGKWYYHNGTTWSAGGEYGAVETDTTLTQSGIPADAKTVGDKISDLKSALGAEITETIVDKGTLVSGEYVKFETGEFLPYGGWSRTGYLPCDKYTQIKLSAGSQYCAFYDSEHGYVKSAKFVANTYLDVPENAAYFAISDTTNALSAVVINAMAKGLEYILNEKMDEVNDTIITEKTMVSDILMDGYLVRKDGKPIASSDWVCTEHIDMPFDSASGYEIRGTFYGTGGAAIYGESGEVLLAITGNNVAEYGGASVAKLETISVPYIEGAKTIRISGWKTKVSAASDLWIKGNTFNGAYEHIYNLENGVKAIEANVSTVISQSKVLVMGDSISTDAYGSYKKWVTDLIEEGFFPSDTTNSSQHATGFVARYNSQPNDFITRIKAIENPSQYDLVVVFGGINDYIQNVPMGEETGTDYTVSFKPAVNEFFDYLIQNFTQARLCVLLPLRNYQNWQNSVGEYQQSYAEYIKTVAKKYCLPVLNLTEDSGFCPYIATFSNMWTLVPKGYQSHDGTHPNAEYEKRFLAPMIKHFLQGML